ncbi:MAG: glycosyltransferase family 2 protein [Planctomycetota bacterium]
MPEVSVIIPTYNSADLVVEAIDSVLVQTYKDYELIIVDDGSTDDTAKVVEAYGDRVRYLYQENAHIAAARNNGFRVSAGKYIAQLDADDLWLPEKLEKQLALFRNYPDAGMVYCDSYICNYGREHQRDQVYSKLYVPQLSGYVFEYFFKTNPLCTSSAVISRVVWEELGGLDTTMRGGQDTEFFMRITAFRPVYCCPEPLMIYRRHGKNTSSAITYATVTGALRKSIDQRLALTRNLLKANVRLPFSISLFSKMPALIQYAMVLWWRLRYGSCRMHSLRLLFRYGSKLVGSWMGKR